MVRNLPVEKKCTGVNSCGKTKSLQDFPPRRDPSTEEIVGYQRRCKACIDRDWKAKRDGRATALSTEVVDDGIEYSPQPSRLFSTAVQEEAIKQIKKDRSLQTCADHIGVKVHTLRYWLDNHREPYASWARRFRAVRDQAHRNPIVDAMKREAEAGSVRAMEFLLKTGWREEFGERQELEMTVRKGADELDETKYTVEELHQLRRLLSKGQNA